MTRMIPLLNKQFLHQESPFKWFIDRVNVQTLKKFENKTISVLKVLDFGKIWQPKSKQIKGKHF